MSDDLSKPFNIYGGEHVGRLWRDIAEDAIAYSNKQAVLITGLGAKLAESAVSAVMLIEGLRTELADCKRHAREEAEAELAAQEKARAQDREHHSEQIRRTLDLAARIKAENDQLQKQAHGRDENIRQLNDCVNAHKRHLGEMERKVESVEKDNAFVTKINVEQARKIAELQNVPGKAEAGDARTIRDLEGRIAHQAATIGNLQKQSHSHVKECIELRRALGATRAGCENQSEEIVRLKDVLEKQKEETRRTYFDLCAANKALTDAHIRLASADRSSLHLQHAQKIKDQSEHIKRLSDALDKATNLSVSIQVKDESGRIVCCLDTPNHRPKGMV